MSIGRHTFFLFVLFCMLTSVDKMFIRFIFAKDMQLHYIWYYKILIKTSSCYPLLTVLFIYLFFSMCFSLQKKGIYFTLIKTKTCRLCALVAHVWQRFDQHCHLLWRLRDGRSTLWQPIVQMAASPWLLSQFSHRHVEVLQFGAGFAAQAVLGARLSPERSNLTTYHTYTLHECKF